MTDEWPRDPSALAGAMEDRIGAVVIRQRNTGNGQRPLHVPAADVDIGERERLTPDASDPTTPLCEEYGNGGYRETIRKPRDTQANRTRWCSKCGGILADLGAHEHFTAPVEEGAIADGGEPTRRKDKPSDGLCPLCDEDFDGHLPTHIRESCPEADGL